MRLLVILILIIAVLPTQGQPTEKKVNWYKGNLHTHSYWSDGDEYPEMIVDWYKSHGYDFIALSDHNILAEGEKWIKVKKSRMYEQGFENYLQRFGKDWVVHKTDSGRVLVRLKTYDQYKTLFESEKFLMIRSEEITNSFQGKPIHMNATNVQSLIPAQTGASVVEVMQKSVDAVLAQRKQTGVPMFPHINHPNFYYAITAQDIMKVKGERFFEVYNGHPLVHNYGDSIRPGTEVMWDMINLEYLKKKQPLLYGLATDDSHNYHQFGSAYSNAGRGWVMVQADALTPSALISAMEAGKFYATTGVVLEEINSSNNRLHIKVNEEPGVRYTIEFIGATRGSDTVSVLQKVEGSTAVFEISKNVFYLRARILSDKLKPNPFQEGDYEMAWTQPISR
jgi:hypothetical protein